MKTSYNILGLMWLAAAASCTSGEGGYGEIKNDRFWTTVSGENIYSQGGGIFTFRGPHDDEPTYYWYGVRYAEAEMYAESPIRKYDRCTFRSVTLYKSRDLVNWQAKPDVMVAEDIAPGGRCGWVGRMGVCYVAEAKEYAMFIQHNNSVLIATAKSPEGPFTPYRHIDMTSRIGTPNTGDQTVFVDDDGQGYLIYSYGRGRNKGYVSRIGIETESDSIGLTDCHEVFRGASREGNCMFKHGGRYYLCASNIYGWDSSCGYYMISDSIYGPYKGDDGGAMATMRDCEADYCHVTQTGFFVTVHGSEQETVIFCGDRWSDFANNGLGYNQWMPLTFDLEGKPTFNSVSAWRLNETTGEWHVSERGNNYVRNGSFEADRRIIPLAVKPRQEFLSGWKTEIMLGTQVGNEIPNSPKLNAFNSTEDEMYVTGKMSMQITDTCAFERRISQTVMGPGGTELADGRYRMEAMINVNRRFDELTMYAGESYMDISKATEGWQHVGLECHIEGGKIEIGFVAKGDERHQCRIDDVSLVKME